MSSRKSPFGIDARRWTISSKVDHQFGVEVRGDGHAPGAGKRRDLAELRQSAPDDVRLEDRDPRMLEEGAQIVTGEVALAADHPRVERLGDAEAAPKVLR